MESSHPHLAAVVLGFLFIALFTVSGCLVDVDYDSTGFLCSSSAPDQCPEAFRCAANRCVSDVSANANCGDGLCTETCGLCAPDCGVCEEVAPLIRWTFDGDGSDVADASGNGRSGQLTAGPTRIDSPRGFALRFDGTGGAVRRPDETAFALQDLTISAWFRSAAGDSNREIVSFGDTVGLRIRGDGTLCVFGWDGVDWFNTSSPMRVDNDSWHHAAGRKNGNQLEVYLDGAQVGAFELGDIDYSTLAGRDWVVGSHGADGGPFPFSGEIDDVRLYGEALSPSAIEALARQQ